MTNTLGAGDFYGRSCALQDGVALVVADTANFMGGSPGGEAYSYPLVGADCNTNGSFDAGDIFAGTSSDADLDGVPDECAGGPMNDCASAPNSSGGAAVISTSGSTSVATNNFTLSATMVPDKPSLFFYGSAQVEVPFGNGRLCVGAPLARLSVVAGVAGNASFTYDLTLPPEAAAQVTAGSTWNFQSWLEVVGPGDLRASRLIGTLGALTYASGDHQASERLSTFALHQLLNEFGAAHFDVAVGMGNLAFLLTARRALAEAQAVFGHGLGVPWGEAGPSCSYSPSGSLVVQMRRDRALKPERGSTRRALALGNPSFGPLEWEDEARGLSSGSSAAEHEADSAFARSLRSLPGSELEAGLVSASLAAAGFEVSTLVGAKGTEDALLRAARGVDVLHLATHGFRAPVDRPYEAALALARTKAEAGDGTLTLGRAGALVIGRSPFDGSPNPGPRSSRGPAIAADLR